MSAIALALIKNGYSISGSDLIENHLMKHLKELGGVIFCKQEERNIDFIKQKYCAKRLIIVISSAIKPTNIELKYCITNHLCIKHRSEILSLIMRRYDSIAVAGTHGKTSTSTFLSTLLDLCTKDCSAIVGGILPLHNSNAHIKDSRYLVAEIDESDGSLSNYESKLGIINNIDFDHSDHFSSIKEVTKSFKVFAKNCESLLINNDCPIASNNFSANHKWSTENKENVEYSMIPKTITKSATIVNFFEKGVFIDELHIPIFGMHNISNLTGAISACRINNISFSKIKENIKFLKLPQRRFEYKGEFLERVIIDDYAHHPREIKATIKLAKLMIKNKHSDTKNRLVVIFQPHRYSRVKEFSDEFAYELSSADIIILTDIYSAGEDNKDKITSKIIGEKISEKDSKVKYVENNYEIKKNFSTLTRRNDYVLIMGAGDCTNLWSMLNQKIS